MATLLGLAVLGQTLTPLQVGGMLLAAVGVVGGQLVTPSRAPRAPIPAPDPSAV